MNGAAEAVVSRLTDLQKREAHLRLRLATLKGDPVGLTALDRIEIGRELAAMERMIERYLASLSVDVRDDVEAHLLEAVPLFSYLRENYWSYYP